MAGLAVGPRTGTKPQSNVTSEQARAARQFTQPAPQYLVANSVGGHGVNVGNRLLGVASVPSSLATGASAAPSGGGVPFTPPPTIGTGTGAAAQAQANPYLQQVMDMYKGLFSQAGDLYNQPLDFAKERADMRTAHSQKLNEMRQMGGQRGQLWTSQIADITDEFGRDIAGAEAGFGNRALEAKRNILGDMSNVLAGLTGASSATAQNQMQQLEQQLGMQQLGLKAWEAQMNLPLEYFKAQQAGQANMLNLVKALI